MKTNYLEKLKSMINMLDDELTSIANSITQSIFEKDMNKYISLVNQHTRTFDAYVKAKLMLERLTNEKKKTKETH